MRNKFLVLSLLSLASVSMWGQKDVTSTYLQNAGFDTESDFVTGSICTYAADVSKNNAVGSSLQAVTGWTASSSGDAHAGGCFAFGTDYWIASSGMTVPATDVNGRSLGGTLGLAGCWDSNPSYSQALTLPASNYKIEICGYNAGTATAFGTQTFGFVENGGTTHYVSTTWTSQNWVTASTTFELSNETAGKFIVGATKVAGGSATSAKLFIDYVKIIDLNAVDKTALNAAIEEALSQYAAGTPGAEEFNAAIEAAKAINEKASATVEEVINAQAALAKASLNYKYAAATPESPINMTNLIVNPSFETGNLNGWTNNGMQVQSNNSFDKKSGSYYAEKWLGSGGLPNSSILQTINNIPDGYYKITAAAGFDGNGAFVVANNDKTEFHANGDYSVITNVTDNTLEIGIKLISSTANYVRFDNFRLEYTKSDPATYETKVALQEQIDIAENLTDKHSAKTEQDLQEALTSAKAALNTGTTIEELNNAASALASVIATVNNSIADYANLKATIDAAENYSVVDGSYTALTTAITIANGVYDAGTTESCADAVAALDAAIKAAKVADYTYVMTNYTEDASLGDWTNTYDTNLKTDEGYDSSTGYYDLWHENSQPSISQTVTLPKGKYALIGIGRGQEVKSTEQLSVKIGSGEPVTVDFLMKGNTGLGVNTAGEADFTTGDGHEYTREGLGQGWEYRFILFELTEESSVTLGANATLSGSWAGVYKLQVKTTTETINTLKITEINALAESAPTTSKMQTSVKTTLEAKIEAASKVAITNTKEELQTAYDELKEAVDAANISIANYKALNELISTSNACYNKAAEGSTDISTAISTAQTAYENAETDATSEIAAIKNALNTYVTANVIDVVVNGKFDENTNGWSTDTGASGKGLATNKEGDFTDKFWENWNNGPKTGKMYQTNATALPAGDYILKIAAFGDQVPAYEGSNLYVFANDQEKAVISDVPTYYYVPFTLSEAAAAGTVEYGLVAKTDNKSQWLGIDNVSISYVSGMGNFLATEDDYQALADAIAAHTLGFEAGEYAPYNNIDAIPTLAAAKAIDPEANNASIAVKETTDALNNASWTVNTEEVNAVYDGTFASSSQDGAPAGWSMSNNTLGGSYHSRTFVGDNRLLEFNDTKSGLFMRFDGTNSDRGSLYYYGKTEGYTMPLAANTAYYVSVDAKNWGATNKPLKLNVTGPSGFTAVGQQLTLTDDADKNDNEPQHFLIVFTTASAGDYIINFQCPGDESNKHSVMISNVELKKAVDINVTINSYGYASFSATYDVAVPTGVEAYYASEATETLVKMTKIEDGKIPANTGVILKGEKGNYTLTATTGAAAISGNLLVPVTTAITGLAATEGINTNYVLKDGKFVTWAVGVTTNVAAGKAYLSVSSSSAALSIDFGDATAINTVNATAVNGTRVNLAGQAVGNGYKGIVIENGKKILVK